MDRVADVLPDHPGGNVRRRISVTGGGLSDTIPSKVDPMTSHEDPE
jgi:hypothetical protein